MNNEQPEQILERCVESWYVVVLDRQWLHTKGVYHQCTGVIYLATWESDPGRTWELRAARRFATRRAALVALNKVKRKYPGKYPNAYLREAEVVVSIVFNAKAVILGGGKRVKMHEVTEAAP